MGKYIIGIESTAHTFSVAVLSRRGRILSDVREVYKAPKGRGIHPTEASQSHVIAAPRILSEAIKTSGVKRNEVEAVAYAMGPGLGPCLRVGAVVARSLASAWEKPLVPVNHAIGHVELGCLLTGMRDPLVLLVSGGHSMVIAFSSGRWRVLGETLDLTLGQLIDQFGRHAGLPSPCGVQVEEAASRSSRYIRLPYSVKGNDVSFSGILTTAGRLLDRGEPFDDLCYSIQETAFAMMVEATERALAFTGNREVMIVGGVAANKRLSQMVKLISDRHSASFDVVPLKYSGDCGSQIAWAGHLAYMSGLTTEVESASTRQSWRLDQVDVPWRR